MNKSALQNIQQALKAMSSEIECVEDETKPVEIQLMLAQVPLPNQKDNRDKP